VLVSGAGEVSVRRDLPIPSLSSGEVLVRVRATSICGTDLEILHGALGYYTSGLARYPIIPGHEWAGEIVNIGSDVSGDFSIGDHVVGETAIPCWSCADCKSGCYHRCSLRKETGIMNKDGSFAEYLAYPVAGLHKINKNIPFSTACLVEPLSVAYNAVSMSVKPNDFVVIFGDGSIGLLALQVAKVFKARKVVVVGNTPYRLDKAKELQADATFDIRTIEVSEEGEESTKQNCLRQLLLEIGEGKLADVIIEAAGHPSAFEYALQSIRDGGKIILLGVHAGKKANISVDDIVLHDVTVRGTIGSPGVWPQTIQLLESGQVDPSTIVTHQFSLSEFTKAIQTLQERKENVIKTIILCKVQGD
jgi:L-iditol 2-dehydrogenase